MPSPQEIASSIKSCSCISGPHVFVLPAFFVNHLTTVALTSKLTPPH